MEEVITPPITAWPKGARCSEPSETENASGIMPNTMANVVIKIGRNRTLAASNKASVQMPYSEKQI